MATKHSNGKPARNKPLRAVGYCRTSGEGQRGNTSIPDQKDRIEAFCGQEGLNFCRHHIDESRSGSKIAGRDDFQQMMRDAANGKFDIVVVLDITRLARDGFDIIESSHTLKREFGIDVVDAKRQFDTRNPRNTLLNFVHAGVSEHERLATMDRTTNGKIRTAKEGKPWSPRPPVGRAYDKKKEHWFVTDKGKTIAEVLRRYVEGEGLKGLCAELGISSPAKISEWVWRGQLAGTYIARFHSPEIEIDEEVPVPQVPEVIPLALLEKVKARLNHNRTYNRHDLRSYVLSGFIRCGNCGKALSGQTPRKKTVYRHKPANGCTINSVRGNEVEEAVLDYLYTAFLDASAFNEAIERAMPSDKHRKGLLKEQAQTTKRLAKNEREIKRLVDAIVKGADPELLLSKQDELKAEREALTHRLEELDHEIAAVPSAEHTQAAAMLTRLRLVEEHKGKDWRKLPFEDVKRFLFHLFGETSLENGSGIFVEKDSKSQMVVTFKGRVDFHHLLANGRPVSYAMRTEATTMNARIRREFERAVQSADKEYRRVLDELKPYTDNQ